MAGGLTARRRRKRMAQVYDHGLVYAEVLELGPRRKLTPGVEVKIKGVPGRFVFLRAVTNREGVTWADFVGGRRGVFEWRSFYPERVATIHRGRTSAKYLEEVRRAALTAKREAR